MHLTNILWRKIKNRIKASKIKRQEQADKRVSFSIRPLFLIIVGVAVFLHPLAFAQQDVSAFVAHFYQQCLNREPDTARYNGWLSQLNSGAPRRDILNAFLNAPEFANQCYKHKISPTKVSATVRRFYKCGKRAGFGWSE